jgi:hypothetical protein
MVVWPVVLVQVVNERCSVEMWELEASSLQITHSTFRGFGASTFSGVKLHRHGH